MSRERLRDSQPRFDGGLNTVSDELGLAPNQMRRAANARLTDYGAVTKRGGTQRITTAVIAAESVQGGYFYPDTSLTFVVLDGVVYYQLGGGAFPWTFTALANSVSTTAVPSFAKFYDGSAECVYVADGGLLNKLNIAGPTLTADIASTAQCTTIVVHNERLWGAGVSTAPDSIFYSALNDGDTLGIGASGGGEIIVRTFADEKVVSLASIGTSLLIFHRRGISRLTGFGQDDITVSPDGVTADVGTIAANSIAAFDNIAYFVSERGLYRCNESEVAPVGTAERPDPLLPILREMTSAQLGAIRTVLNRATRELWVYLPGYGVYVYHTLLNAWAGPWTDGYLNPQTTALFDANDAQGLPIVFKGDASGWISLCDSETAALDNIEADGTAGDSYTMTVQLHRQYCGDDAEAKALRWGYLTAELNGSSQCSVSWSTNTSYSIFGLPTDASSSGTWGVGVWGVGLWAVGSGSQSYRIPMSGNGYYVDVTITDSGETLPVFSRWQMECFALGRR